MDAPRQASATEWERIEEAAASLRERLGARVGAGSGARVGIVLGSGLGAFASRLGDAVAIPFADIPHFPVSGVEGHAGRLLAGTLEGVAVLLLQGRVHGYEGHSADAIVFAVRTLAALGVRVLVLTNAAGAIRAEFAPGQLVLLADHINLSGMNPAAGPLLGTSPRFFDMSEAYSRRLRALAREGCDLQEAVYVSVPGPSFETPAEIRAFRAMGAGLVGMSTTLETIAARQAGVEVLGVSCVTNMAAGVTPATLSHAEVMDVGREAEGALAALLTRFVPRAAALTGIALTGGHLAGD